MKLRVRNIYLLANMLFTFGVVQSADAVGNSSSPERYNVVWDSPSKDSNGTMPLGNGDITANVWVDKNGDINFYIGKTDAWGDNARLLKVGKVCVKCEPALFTPGTKFQQTLDLKTGSIKIRTSNTEHPTSNIQVFIDANHPVINVAHESSVPVKMTAFIDLWRTKQISLKPLASDVLSKHPERLLMVVEPDTIIKNLENAIGWYHHNIKSVGPAEHAKTQGVTGYKREDPLLNRIFGGIITGTDTERINDTSLSTKPTKSGHISVHILTKHPSSPGEWIRDTKALINKTEKTSFKKRHKAHNEWWRDFWDRSWIHVSKGGSSADDSAYTVSRAYALQRFIDAGAGRGAYPIKFNGSIFTAPHEGDPDYRCWGPGYWWQNTRLPYISMCAAGDYDLFQPLVEMYVDRVLPLNIYRTRRYFNHGGAYYAECIHFWGDVFNQCYGWQPMEEREDPLQTSGWHKWEWVAGPELAFMLMDYYDYTLDEKFLKEKVIPLTIEVLKYFDEHYKTDKKGELVMFPSMACETWWDCTNPMPELAGLYAMTKRLLALSDRQLSQENRKFCEQLAEKLPPLPTREVEGKKAFAPATRYENKRNSENPELYCVFPFRLASFEKDNVELGVHALDHRWNKGAQGWRQDDIFMAYLGLADQAKMHLVHRCMKYHKDSRFPAFWGPNFDWVPDQTHGGVIMKALQAMILQPDPYSRKVYVAPAWPKDWNCDFKLHAPYQTVIKGCVKDGKLVELKVTPESRAKDVVNSWGDQPIRYK